jgi:hypothetical protein
MTSDKELAEIGFALVVRLLAHEKHAQRNEGKKRDSMKS